MKKCFRFTGLVLVTLCWLLPLSTYADASGPDFFRTKGIALGQGLNLQQSPQADAEVLNRIPANTACLKNLGCQGGLTLDEFTSLSHEAQQKRLLENPRWCKVEYLGRSGWVAGRFLEEDACPSKQALPKQQEIRFEGGQGQIYRKGRIRGNESLAYLVHAEAGQTLSVNLKAKHPQIYFNVSPADTGVAMFIGNNSGDTMQRRVPADGDYLVDVYFMRAAARRGASGEFALAVGLKGKPLTALAASQDALVAGTGFHATAMVDCHVPYNESVKSCSAGVVRRGFDGSATVVLSWPQGRRQILFIKGEVVASDSTQMPSAKRSNGSQQVRVDADEFFDIPDVLLTGG